MYYLKSENKGADQLLGYREADLHLCFRLCRLLVFPWGSSYMFIIFGIGKTSLSITDDYNNMNLNATKCTFGHSDITSRKQKKAGK